MITLASDAMSTLLGWLARAPDVLIVLLCCFGACLAALPVARATGLVGLLASRERRLSAQLDQLAAACAGLATRSDGQSAKQSPQAPAAFRSAFSVLAAVVERRVPPHEAFAAASTEADRWLQNRAAKRQPLRAMCSAGPAIALGTALGTLTLMAEVWANPAAMSSGAALGIGLLVLVCVGALSIFSTGAMWLEEAERADRLACGVLLESARMIAGGGSAEDISRRTAMILRPRTAAGSPAPARKAA